MIDVLLQTVVGCALAALLAAAAIHKQRAGVRFEAQLAEYRLLPEVLVPILARLLMLVEAITALALLVPGLRQGAAIVAALLLAGYAFAIGINLLRGRDWIDCGCGDTAQLLSPWLLVRNLVLAGGALLVALPASGRSLTLLDGVLGALGFLVLVVLWMIVEVLLANASVLREWSEARD